MSHKSLHEYLSLRMSGFGSAEKKLKMKSCQMRGDPRSVVAGRIFLPTRYTVSALCSTLSVPHCTQQNTMLSWKP